MRVIRDLLRLLCRASLMAGCLILAWAGETQAQSCSFVASDIVLGPVDVLGTRPTDGVGGITGTCFSFLNVVSSVEMWVHVGQGLGGLSGTQRRMTSATTTTGLGYQLYKDSARSAVFGSSYTAVGGQPLYLSGGSLLNLLSTSALTIPIYARVPGGQANVVPGIYASGFSRDPLDVRIDYRTCNLLFFCTVRTATFSFTVRAQALPDCRVDAGPLDFGTHGVLSQPVNASSQIGVTCTAGTSYNIGLGYGLGGIGFAGRQMKDLGGNGIKYQLYRDQARTQPWGLSVDGLGLLGAGTGAMNPMVVYGQVPPQPTPPPGTYADTVVVTVNY